MRAGLDCGLDGGEPSLQEMLGSDDFVGYAAAIPAAGVRGQTFAYCSPGYQLVSAALTQLTGVSLAEYAATVLFDPLGIEQVQWEHDARGITPGWGDLSLLPADLARIGELVVRDGIAGDVRLLPAGFVDEVRSAAPTDDPGLDYGLGFWLPTGDSSGVLEGIGRGGQELYVWPAEELVVVVTGAQADGRLIAQIVAGTVASDAASAPETDAEIAARVTVLAAEPAASSPSSPADDLPIDQTYDLEPNPLGIDRVAITQQDPEILRVLLTSGALSFDLPIGLDGIRRTAVESPTGHPVHLAGTWTGSTLVVDYEELAGPEHWTIDFDVNDQLVMTVIDVGDRFPPITIRGEISP